MMRSSPIRFATTSTAIAAAAASALWSAYLGLLTVAAIAARSRRAGPDPLGAGLHRFAVFVPAHDEQSVIRDTVAALVAQRYPEDRYAVHVVADNCSDRTAEYAAGAGATVHVRTFPEPPGKGPSLNWLHQRLDGQFDVIAVVDADTIAEPGFLAAMDRAFVDGAHAAQGHYTVRDPDSSPTVALRYAALACRHHLRPLGRTALGASCGLYGNGMAFRSDLLERQNFSGHLIEDAELQLELLLDGTSVVYVPDARVLAEMPADLAASRTQNERWELGRAQLVRRFTTPLVRRLVRGGSLPRRAYADGLADLLTPPLSALAAAQLGAVTLCCTSLALRPSRAGRFATAFSLGSIVVLGFHVTASLRLVGAPRQIYRSLLHAPRMVVWKLGLLARISRRPNSVSWTRTTRNADQEST